MKNFENLTKIEDFSNFVRNWRFLKFWSNLIIIIQILDKIEDIWTFHKNLKIFQILELKIFENLVKIEDFSNFGQNWRFLKTWKMSELKKKRFLCWDLNTPVIWSPIQVSSELRGLLILLSSSFFLGTIYKNFLNLSSIEPHQYLDGWPYDWGVQIPA